MAAAAAPTRLAVYPGGYEECAALDPRFLRHDGSEVKRSKKSSPPRSGFFFFMLDVRKERYPGHSLEEMPALAGPLWDDLDPDLKKSYVHRAK